MSAECKVINCDLKTNNVCAILAIVYKLEAHGGDYYTATSVIAGCGREVETRIIVEEKFKQGKSDTKPVRPNNQTTMIVPKNI